MQLVVRLSASLYHNPNPNPNPNPSCQTHVHLTNPNPTLTLTLTKRGQEITWINNIYLWFRIPRQYFFWQDTRTHTLQKSITNSWFLAMHSLTFNPTRTTRKTLHSSGNHSPVPSFYFMEMAEPKSTLIHLWINQTTHSCLLIQANFFQTAYRPSTKNSTHLIQNVFQPISKIRLVDSLFHQFLSNQSHIVKRAGCCTT